MEERVKRRGRGKIEKEDRTGGEDKERGERLQERGLSRGRV